MTDLDKARSELLEIVSQVSQGSWTIVLLASMERVIETARREGAELADWQRKLEREAGAEEMRERAARVADASGYWATDCVAAAVRALPLTPEEPAAPVWTQEMLDKADAEAQRIAGRLKNADPGFGYRCVHGHDKCAEMYPGPECPYCERPEEPA